MFQLGYGYHSKDGNAVSHRLTSILDQGQFVLSILVEALARRTAATQDGTVLMSNGNNGNGKKGNWKRAMEKTATEDWATGKLDNGKIRQWKIKG